MQLSLSWHWISGKNLDTKQLYSILSLRQEVFVVEQNCPYLDTDGFDFDCFHLLGLSDNDALVAYARVFPPSLHDINEIRIYIGRVIVKQEYRNLKVGHILMQKCHGFASQEFCQAHFALHAQAHLQVFYSRLGYQPKGDLFDEDGIPHILMIRPVLRD